MSSRVILRSQKGGSGHVSGVSTLYFRAPSGSLLAVPFASISMWSGWLLKSSSETKLDVSSSRKECHFVAPNKVVGGVTVSAHHAWIWLGTHATLVAAMSTIGVLVYIGVVSSVVTGLCWLCCWNGSSLWLPRILCMCCVL